MIKTLWRPLVFLLILASGVGPAHATVVDTDPPSGLMIQISSLTSTTTLKTWMEDVRKNHRNPAKPGYINNLVLQDIADVNGNLLTAYLDVLAPYLPGGATPAFTKVSIGGAADQPWTGSGQKYIEGIEDPTFRNRNVALSVSTGRAFKARYPLVRFDWYLPFEANVGAFWDGNIEAAYVAYVNSMTSGLLAVKAGGFTWSPAFWTPYRSMASWMLPALQANLTDFFTKVRPFTMDLQDFVGQSGGATTKEDAVVWAKYLKTNWASRLVAVQLNAEQFKQDSSGGITAGDPIEVPAREKYYASQGVSVGPSFEIRFWHQRLYGI